MLAITVMAPWSLHTFMTLTPWSVAPLLCSTMQTVASVKEEVLEKQKQFKDESSVTTAKVDEDKVKQLEEDFMQEIELELDIIVSKMMDKECEIDYESSAPMDELCVEDSEERTCFRNHLKSIIRGTVQVVQGTTNTDIDTEGLSEGEILEKGWEQCASTLALVHNAEVWKFALRSAFKVLSTRKLKLKRATEEELQDIQTEAAKYIHDGLLALLPPSCSSSSAYLW